MALDLADQTEAVWWLLCTGFLFLGLVGLSLIEAGMCRPKFSEAALIKNLVQFALAVVCWWLLGYGFSYGNVGTGFLGVNSYGGKDWMTSLIPLKATAIGFVGVSVIFIINGAIAERTHYILYVILTAVLMLFAWPVVVAWSWGQGWLSNMGDPFQDDGGCATVHLFAGSIALVGVLFVQPRLSRGESTPAFSMTSSVYLTLGTVFYFIHLCFLNALLAPTIVTRGYAMFNTWLGAAMTATVACFLGSFLKKDVETQFIFLQRGFIAGAVVVSSIADDVSPWEVFCMGVVGGVFFVAAYFLEDKLGVDDVTFVVPVHFVQGVIGTFAVGLWNNELGGFHQNAGLLLGTQVAGLVSIMSWAVAFGIGIFGFLYLLKWLVIDRELQFRGLNDADMTTFGFKQHQVEEGEGIELGPIGARD